MIHLRVAHALGFVTACGYGASDDERTDIVDQVTCRACKRRMRAQLIHDVSRAIGDYAPGLTERQIAANHVIRMMEEWETIESNFGAEEVGLGDTPEEVEKWERAFLAAGESILQLARMIVED